ELPRATKGVVVVAVEAGDAAEDAGLSRGDVIVSVNGAPVGSVADFEKEIDRARPDGVARLRVRRGSAYSFLVLTLKGGTAFIREGDSCLSLMTPHAARGTRRCGRCWKSAAARSWTSCARSARRCPPSAWTCRTPRSRA